MIMDMRRLIYFSMAVIAYLLTASCDKDSRGIEKEKTGEGNTVSFATNSATQRWLEETDGTFGKGYLATTRELKVGFYQHIGSTAPVPPNENEVRIYKKGVLIIHPLEGRRIKRIVIGCAPGDETTSYCCDMMGLEGGASATADKSALTITWLGSAGDIVLYATGQVRMVHLTVEFDNPALTTKEAIEAAQDLTWTSNTEFDMTDDLYIQGRITRISTQGFYINGGTYGNASFYIASDLTPNFELYCFRLLYLDNQKYAGGRDIEVGDQVVIYGKVMNYRGSLIETVPGKAYLYSFD